MTKDLVVRISIICILVLFFLSLANQATAKLQETQMMASEVHAKQQEYYLPSLYKNACLSSAIPSPFSLQIAAIHQVSPTNLQSDSEAGGSLRVMTISEEQEFFTQEAYERLTDALRDSGAGWTRIFLQWTEIEPEPALPGQPPDYNWDWYDGRIEQIARTGVQVVATVGVAPYWAAETPCSPFYDQHMATFARFVSDVVERYSAPPYNIKHWELINEPDGVAPDSWQYGWGCWGLDGDKYAEMLAAAYPAIKAADPLATVLLGGMAYDHFYEYQEADLCGEECNFNRYFIDDVLAHGGGQFFDALNYHYFPAFAPEWERWNLHPATCGNVHDGVGDEYYAGGIDLIAKTNHLRNRTLVCHGADKPVWVTELAEHGYPDTLIDQARYVIVGNVRALAADVKNITWYALVTVNDPFEQGLLDNDWNPKPGFRAYQALTSQLTGYEYIQSLAVTNGGEAYLFRNPCGQEKAVAWGTGIVTFSPANLVRVVDREGIETLVYDGGAGDADGQVNGSISLQLSEDPLFIQVLSP
jgi:hypothetical protein